MSGQDHPSTHHNLDKCTPQVIIDRWCPVRGDDGQEYKMSPIDWNRDWTAEWNSEWNINRLLVKCEKCEVECTVKRYRKYDCSTGHCKGINSLLISPRLQWDEYICPECDELMNDPIQTSCGHRMCYKCFDKRRKNYRNRRCLAQDDDNYQEHEMTWDYWFKDKAIDKKISKLLMKCDKCEAKCTVEEYRKYHATSTVLSQEQAVGLCRFLINDCKEDLPHWKKILSLQDGSELSGITDDELFSKALPAEKCAPFVLCLQQCSCPKCEYLLNMLSDLSVVIDDEESTSHLQQGSTADAVYAKLAGIKTFQELEKVPLDQQQKLVTQVLREALPAAKNDLKIDEIRYLLHHNGVITNEESTELLEFCTGEDKITRLYTKMLPVKGMNGLKKYMEVLLDTGWKTPSHMRHLGLLSTILSEKLIQIDNESTLHEYERIEAAREAIVPMVYSESLPDAVRNLSMSINKLLIPMLKKRLVTTMEYFWLCQTFCPGEKVQELYEVFLPQKGVKGLKAFMEVLQDVGRKIPKYQNHRDLLKSSLQVHLSKF